MFAATSRLTGLYFAPAETPRAYLVALRRQVLADPCPLAFYADRHGDVRGTAKAAVSGDGNTEFGRVAARLRIDLVGALTPQAKGRVERANQTLRDRLAGEMRPRPIAVDRGRAGRRSPHSSPYGMQNSRFRRKTNRTRSVRGRGHGEARGEAARAARGAHPVPRDK